MLWSEWTIEVPSGALTLRTVYRNAECGLCFIWNKHDDIIAIIGPTISNSPTKHKLCKLLEAHCHQSSTVMLLPVYFHCSEYMTPKIYCNCPKSRWLTDTLTHRQITLWICTHGNNSVRMFHAGSVDHHGDSLVRYWNHGSKTHCVKYSSFRKPISTYSRPLIMHCRTISIAVFWI